MTIPQLQVSDGAPIIPDDGSLPKVSSGEKKQVELAAKVDGSADSILDKSDLHASDDSDISATSLQVKEDDNPELDEAEKKKKELDEEKAKMKKQEWINLAAGVGVVAMTVIGVFAFSFAIAALAVGATALEVSIAVIIGGVAFAGAGLTLYFALVRPGWKEKMKVLKEDDK